MFARITQAAALAAMLASPALAQPQTGITLGMVLEPPTLDPTGNAAAAVDEIVYANVFEGLTRIGPDGQVLPGLAESWQAQDGGKAYLFQLRPNVTFHDGSSFDAQDVVFSLDRARAADSTNAQKALFQGIESVQPQGPLSVRVTLKAADGSFPFKMAWGDAVMVDQASIAQIATHPVGTGPFRFQNWVQGDRVNLSAYDGYWGEKPALQTATFRFIPDPTAAFAAMMAGDVDAFPIYPAPETLPQLQADPRFKVLVGTTEGETILAMNHARPPLDDIRLRKAIAHAINRDEIIQGAMFGYGTPIGSHFPPHHPDYIDLTAQSTYDPQMTKALLAETGSENLTLRLALPPTPYARRGGEIVAAQLRAAGIDTRITNMEWAQWLDQVFRNADYDMTIISHVEPMDIDIYARPDYYFNYRNPAFDNTMTRLDATTDPAERADLLKQAQKILADDYANVFLFQLAKTGVAKTQIQGLWQNAPMPANDLSRVRWTN